MIIMSSRREHREGTEKRRLLSGLCHYSVKSHGIRTTNESNRRVVSAGSMLLFHKITANAEKEPTISEEFTLVYVIIPKKITWNIDNER